jgi:hypothetical protein
MNRSIFRYAVFRWLMPHLYHDPLFLMNMAEKALPKVAAITAGRQYTDRIDSVDCGPTGYNENSSVLEECATTSRPVVLKGYIQPGSWTLDRVKSEVGENIKPVRVGSYDDSPTEPDVVEMRVADFIDHLEGPSFAASQFNGLMPFAIGGGPMRPWQERAYMRGWG